MTELAGFSVAGRAYAMRKNSGMLSGIDVSHHQRRGTFSLDGHDFLIVRAAYGSKPDETAVDHAKVGHDAGVPVGAYLFYRQSKPREAQLETFVRVAELAGATRIAPTVDLEWPAKDPKTGEYYDGEINPDKFNSDGRWLVEQLAKRYGQCMVYTAPFFWRDVMGAPEWVAEHSLWLAHYTKPGWPALPHTAPMTMKHWAIHQFQGAPLDTNVCQYLPLSTPVADTDPAPPPET